MILEFLVKKPCDEIECKISSNNGSKFNSSTSTDELLTVVLSIDIRIKKNG
jgi:hypothetical protein